MVKKLKDEFENITKNLQDEVKGLRRLVLK